MTWRILFLCIVPALFFSCKKEYASATTKPATVSIENAKVIAAGNVFFTSKPTIGTARIYQQKNNNYLLSLQQMNVDIGRALVIYLSSTPTLSSSSVKIFTVRSLGDDVIHDLPGGIDFRLYKYVFILVEPTEEMIASGELGV